MSKVYQLNDAVDHSITQGDQCVDTAERYTIYQLLKKLIAEQVSVYRRTNVVKSEKFSEIMQRAINAYLNGMLTNEEVIAEMLKLAKQLAEAHKEGEQLGLTADELAFYDALTKPQAIKDFYKINLTESLLWVIHGVMNGSQNEK